MKQSEKNFQKEPAASPPNPGRRKFLRNILVAAALAPPACSKGQTENARQVTLIQNRPFPLGGIALVLTSCREGNEFSSATIEVYKDGGSGPEHSVSMLAPGSFRFQGGGFEYELYVESISCGKPNSASAVLVKKGAAARNGAEGDAEGADLFTIGAGAAFLASIFFAIFERKSKVPDDGFLLPPKRNH